MLALRWAMNHTDISETDMEVIMQAKRSLLCSKGESWTKKGDPFDVPMGSYDGAESCELVGLFMLHQMEELHMEAGLYRDDGLMLCRGTPREVENVKKAICDIYQANSLRITCEANRKCVNYLDVFLNLSNGDFGPYMKEGNTPLYVNQASNHPPCVLNSIPLGINTRLSRISSSKVQFDRAKQPYQEALTKSGYKHVLEYQEPIVMSSKRKRRRNTIYFNPPYSCNVATNIGRKFINLVEKCFPPGSSLRSTFNRNNMKVSYSCMPNVANVITSHNARIMRKHDKTPHLVVTAAPPVAASALPPVVAASPAVPRPGRCNCRVKEKCPVPGICQTKSVIYQARVVEKLSGQTECYVGLTEGEFKTRYNGHTSSFRLPAKRGSTTLSEHIWRLQDAKLEFDIHWKFLKQVSSYSPNSGKCVLCLTEKQFIIYKHDLASLNNRSELSSSCRHKAKFLLTNC
jgi:hypothetical protein